MSITEDTNVVDDPVVLVSIGIVLTSIVTVLATIVETVSVSVEFSVNGEKNESDIKGS